MTPAERRQFAGELARIEAAGPSDGESAAIGNIKSELTSEEFEIWKNAYEAVKKYTIARHFIYNGEELIVAMAQVQFRIEAGFIGQTEFDRAQAVGYAKEYIDAALRKSAALCKVGYEECMRMLRTGERMDNFQLRMLELQENLPLQSKESAIEILRISVTDKFLQILSKDQSKGEDLQWVEVLESEIADNMTMIDYLTAKCC